MGTPEDKSNDHTTNVLLDYVSHTCLSDLTCACTGIQEFIITRKTRTRDRKCDGVGVNEGQGLFLFPLIINVLWGLGMDSLNSLLIGFYTLLSYSYSQRHTHTERWVVGNVTLVQ
jgi:hypothetical protein